MDKNGSKTFHFRRRAIFITALATIIFGSFYFFNVSAQTEETAEKQTAAQSLVNGRLAFSSMSFGGIPEGFIHTSNPDGTDRTVVPPIGSPSFAGDPAWSPDGTKVVYAWTQTPYDLHVINPNGSGALNLTNTPNIREDSPSWSVTGKIAYVRSTSNSWQVWVINPDGTGNAQFPGITQSFQNDPAWSPDGTKLAFASGSGIWVINADGSNERRVTNSQTNDRFPSWSPDGTKIVFSKPGSGIAVVNADGTNETLLAAGGTQPAWSPDGTKIAFYRDGINTMEVNGSNQIRIVANTSSFPQCCDIVYEHVVVSLVGQRAAGQR